jgi:hypothetical protein
MRALSLTFIFAMGWALWSGGCEALANGDGPDLPEGYSLLYSQDFESENAIDDFEFTDPAEWRLAEKKGTRALEFTGTGKYRPKVRSPNTIALLTSRVFGDFILEANLLQTGREYGHRDMCLFFGFTDPSKYYYVHIATKADPNAHNIFVVNDVPRTNIARKTTEGIDWGQDQWHKVRLVRKIAEGTVAVFFDDMTQPLMVAEDTTFGVGGIGFGSFDDAGMIDNINIWGPPTFFEKKEPPAGE